MAFEVPAGILYLLILIADFLMIEATSNSQIGYYVMGRKSPLIAATVLAAVAFLVEFIKGKFRADAR